MVILCSLTASLVIFPKTVVEDSRFSTKEQSQSDHWLVWSFGLTTFLLADLRISLSHRSFLEDYILSSKASAIGSPRFPIRDFKGACTFRCLTPTRIFGDPLRQSTTGNPQRFLNGPPQWTGSFALVVGALGRFERITGKTFRSIHLMK